MFNDVLCPNVQDSPENSPSTRVCISDRIQHGRSFYIYSLCVFFTDKFQNHFILLILIEEYPHYLSLDQNGLQTSKYLKLNEAVIPSNTKKATKLCFIVCRDFL